MDLEQRDIVVPTRKVTRLCVNRLHDHPAISAIMRWKGGKSMKLCGNMKLTSLGEQQKQQTFASFVLHRFVIADFHATQRRHRNRLLRITFAPWWRFATRRAWRPGADPSPVLEPPSSHGSQFSIVFPFQVWMLIQDLIWFDDNSWVCKIEKPKSQWAWTCSLHLHVVSLWHHLCRNPATDNCSKSPRSCIAIRSMVAWWSFQRINWHWCETSASQQSIAWDSLGVRPTSACQLSTWTD